MDDIEPHVLPFEKRDNSHLLSEADKRLPADQLVRKLLDMRYVEITDGLPADSSKKLYEIIISYLDLDLTGDFDLPFDPIGRFPILAYKSNENKVRTFLLTYPGKVGKMNHITLERLLRKNHGFKLENLVFTTSFESISSYYDPADSYLKCDLMEAKSMYIKLQRGSDYFKNYPLNLRGKEILAEIAQNTPGVTFIA